MVLSDARLVRMLRNRFDGWSADVFACITADESMARLTCAFYSVGPRSRELASALGIAFQVAYDDMQRRKGNPFLPLSKAREPIKGPLFRLQIHRADLTAVRQLGNGQFGEVYLADQVVKDAPAAGGGFAAPHVVRRAVKLLRNTATGADKAEFLREAETMLELQHPNLVRLVGVAVQQRPWLTVLEYMTVRIMARIVARPRLLGAGSCPLTHPTPRVVR